MTRGAERWDSLRVFTPPSTTACLALRSRRIRCPSPPRTRSPDTLRATPHDSTCPCSTESACERLWRGGDRSSRPPRASRWEARNVVVATGLQPGTQGARLRCGTGAVRRASSTPANTGTPGNCRTVRSWWWDWGTPGAEIAIEVVRTHPTTVAGKPGGGAPGKTRPDRGAILPAVGAVHRAACPHARYADRAQGGTHHSRLTQNPWSGRRPRTWRPPACRRVPRVAGVASGLPGPGGRDPAGCANVIWCTGFRDDFSWIDPAMLDDGALPPAATGRGA